MRLIEEVPKGSRSQDRPNEDVTIVDCGVLPVEEPYPAEF